MIEDLKKKIDDLEMNNTRLDQDLKKQQNENLAKEE